MSRVFALSQYISTASGRRTRLLVPFSPVSLRAVETSLQQTVFSVTPEMLRILRAATLQGVKSAAHVAGFDRSVSRFSFAAFLLSFSEKDRDQVLMFFHFPGTFYRVRASCVMRMIIRTTKTEHGGTRWQ